MIDTKLQNYIDYEVKPVIKIKNSYGYRIILKYADGTERVRQKSGFVSVKEATQDRDSTVGKLFGGTYCVYENIKVSEFMEFWLENDIKTRVRSYETYYNFKGIVKNHINPYLGNKKIDLVSKSDVQSLYNAVAGEYKSVARVVKTVINIAMKYAVSMKIIAVNPAEGVSFRRSSGNHSYNVRNIDSKRTLSYEQIITLIENSKDTPIYIQVLLNVLMGLRRSEIIAVKYSDIDYVNRTLRVERQLGKSISLEDGELAPKTRTKQEVPLKTASSQREVPIPDYVFEAIMEERVKYQRNKSRRSKGFQDLDYICCSTYGRPRSKNFHWKHYKELLKDSNLPDIRWHDLRSTFCTLLLKNDFNPKAVSKLMGHSKEIITVDIYGDNREIIAEKIPELEEFIREVAPVDGGMWGNDNTDIMPRIEEYV